MFDLLISLGWGTFSLTREKAEKIVGELLEKGKMKKEESKQLLRALVERGEKERADFRDFINKEIDSLIRKGSLISRNEFIELEQRIRRLEEQKGENHQELS